MTILFEFGTQSMGVMSLSRYLAVGKPVRWNQIARTPVVSQVVPPLDNIRTPFELMLTASSDPTP